MRDDKTRGLTTFKTGRPRINGDALSAHSRAWETFRNKQATDVAQKLIQGQLKVEYGTGKRF
jgi:hypothetical protein